MTSDEIVFKRAGTKDVEAFYGKPPVVRMRGFVATAEGHPVMLGGILYHQGTMVLFSELKPEARKCKKAIAKGIRILMGFIEGLTVPIYAFANPDEPTAPYLLCKLGFKPTGVLTPQGEYLVREPS